MLSPIIINSYLFITSHTGCEMGLTGAGGERGIGGEGGGGGGVVNIIDVSAFVWHLIGWVCMGVWLVVTPVFCCLWLLIISFSLRFVAR